ncbi:MAG: ThuA domain-containing protein [Verrucomicrobia bacterium]|nr:ThuA domain-containing protein [Verrucomicrobiota bacterium]
MADHHYGARSGWHLYNALRGDVADLHFFEDDLSVLSNGSAMQQCRLLVLNRLAGETLSDEAELNVKAYLEQGGNILLLHCGSAAFEQWVWWRKLVGLRWVRPDDPAEVAASSHPVRSYQVRVVNRDHPLRSRLQEMSLPDDEIYIHLEQVCPVTCLMETTTEEGTFCQCCECVTPWGGRIVSFLPGHAEGAVKTPALVHNVLQLVDYLTPSDK